MSDSVKTHSNKLPSENPPSEGGEGGIAYLRKKIARVIKRVSSVGLMYIFGREKINYSEVAIERGKKSNKRGEKKGYIDDVEKRYSAESKGSEEKNCSKDSKSDYCINEQYKEVDKVRNFLETIMDDPEQTSSIRERIEDKRRRRIDWVVSNVVEEDISDPELLDQRVRELVEAALKEKEKQRVAYLKDIEGNAEDPERLWQMHENVSEEDREDLYNTVKEIMKVMVNRRSKVGDFRDESLPDSVLDLTQTIREWLGVKSTSSDHEDDGSVQNQNTAVAEALSGSRR